MDIIFVRHPRRRYQPVYGTSRSRIRLTAKLVAFLLASTPMCTAQHVLYSQKQDKSAQDALAAGKEITSGAQFDKMLHNLDDQAKTESEAVLAFTREQMRASLQAIEDWSPPSHSDLSPTDTVGPPLCKKYVRCSIELIQNRLTAGTILDAPGDATAASARVAEIEAKSAELKKAVEQLQQACKTKDPAVLEALSHLGDAKDLVAYGKKIQSLTQNAELGTALGRVSDGLDELTALYNTTKGIWDGYKAVNVDITSLRPSREAIQIKALALEEQHLKALSRIRANEALEVGDRLAIIQEAIASVKRTGMWDSSERVTTTLQAAAAAGIAVTPPDPTRLRGVVDALMLTAAVLAPSDASVRLSSNRESDEERRFSLRISALNTSTYDSTVQAALQRLAVYYRGGLKPTDLAQLIFFITNSVSVPIIASK